MKLSMRTPFLLRMLWFVALTSSFGACAPSISLGLFELFPFRAFFIVFATLVLFMLLLHYRTGRVLKLGNAYSPYILVFALWGGYSIASFFWSNDIGPWIYATYSIFVGLFFLLFYSAVGWNKKYILSVFKAFNISVLIQSIFGWIEVVTGRYFFLDSQRAAEYRSYNYPTATIYNTNDFATVLLAGVFICLICICYCQRKKMVFFYSACVLEYVVLMHFTESRANFMALFLGLGSCFLMRKHKKIGLGIGGFVVVLAVLLIVFIAVGEEAGTSDSIRINLIFDGFSFLLETYGLGIGAGQDSWWLMNRSTHQISGIYDLHNFWIEILVCYGVVIFVLFLCLYLKTFFNFWLLHNDKGFFDAPNICCGYMVAFILSSVSSSSLASSEWFWFIFTLYIAFSISLAEDQHRIQHYVLDNTP